MQRFGRSSLQHAHAIQALIGVGLSGQLGLAAPHVCGSRGRVVRAIEIATEDGQDHQGSAQSVGILGQLAVLGDVGEHGDLGIVQDGAGRKFGCIASEASESEQAPGDDGLDGEAAFQSLALWKLILFISNG